MWKRLQKKNPLNNKIYLAGLSMLILFSGISLAEFSLRKIFNDFGIPSLNFKLVSFLSIVFVGVFVVYLKIIKLLKFDKKNNYKKILPLAIIFFITIQLILILIPPTGSADLYNYIFTTKILTYYHQNPYTIPEGNFNNDPLNKITFSYAHNVGLIYGPLWLFIYLIPSFLSNTLNNIWLSTILFKLIAILFSGFSAYLIFKILEITNKKYQYLGTILYLLNPFLLYEIGNNGHNDIIMVFFLLLSIFFWLKNKDYLSLSFLILSSLIKIISIILLPVLILVILNKKNLIKDKIKFIIKSVLILGVIYYLAFLVSGGETNIIQGIINQGKMFNPLSLSLFPFLLKIIKINPTIIKLSSSILFLLFYIFILLKIIFNKEKTKLIENYLSIFIFYFIFGSTMFMPWYFIWAIPLSIIICNNKINLTLTGWGLIAYTTPSLIVFFI